MSAWLFLVAAWAWVTGTPVRLAIAALLSGGLVGLATAFATMLIAASENQNYRHIGFLGDMVVGMVGGAIGFWLGVYMLLGGAWLFRAGPRGPSPGLTTTATLLGFVAGGMLVTVLTAPLYMPLFTLSPLLVSVVNSTLTPIGALAGAVGAAVLAQRLVLPRWPKLPARALQLAATTVAAGIVLVTLGAPRTDFPGGEAPLAERRAWAAKTFGTRYVDSETYLKGHRGVREAIGVVKAVGPVPGPNRTSSSPGEMMGTFTLQVVGDRGEGVAHLEFFHGNGGTGVASYQFKGRFVHPGPPVSLN